MTRRAGTLAWQQRYGLSDTQYDYTGVLAGAAYALPGLPPRIFITPLLVGATATTDPSGYARFRSLGVQLGLPGRYVLSLAAPGQATSAPAVTKLDFGTSVASIRIVSLNASAAVPVTAFSPVAFGQALPSFAVQVWGGQRVAFGVEHLVPPSLHL